MTRHRRSGMKMPRTKTEILAKIYQYVDLNCEKDAKNFGDLLDELHKSGYNAGYSDGQNSPEW